MIDPMEQAVRAALKDAGIKFVEAPDPRALNLDFFLIQENIHVEVKQFHSDRIAEQMSRAPNVIAIQGMDAARLVAKLLRASRS